MKTSSSEQKSKECCFAEKENLMESLRACEFCTDSIEDLRLCYSRAAKVSGRRAKSCLVGS